MTPRAQSTALAANSLVIPAPVLEDLARVEDRLTRELGSKEERLTDIAKHLVGAGGKRVRPTVVLLAFHATASQGSLARRDDAIEAAVALELIHSATLLHDDIIDGGETRRGKPSALKLYGVADTLVAGDFLFSRAFALCARFEAEVVRWAAEACVLLTEGEILQGRFRHNPSVTLDDYHQIIERKTASLFTTGARTAAHLAGGPASLIDAMAACGRHVGLAFQVSDDLLDVVGSPNLTGKPRGIDLRDGNPSLPIVLALGSDRELARLFASERLTGGEVEAGLDRIRRSGVLEAVAARATNHAQAALTAIDLLPDSPSRTALRTLIEGLVVRSA